MAADLARPEGADRSRPSLETTKGEGAESAKTADVRVEAQLVGSFPSHSSDELPQYIQIDRLRYAVNAWELTGAEIRNIPLPAIRDDYDLWYHGGAFDQDVHVRDDQIVSLRGARFYTAPKFINAGSDDARRAAALTDSAGELVRLRDSQQKDLEHEVALLRSALERVAPILANAEQAFRDPPVYNDPSLTGYRFEGLASGTAIGVRVVAEALARRDGASLSSSVSPSLTEKDLGSGENRSAPDGGLVPYLSRAQRVVNKQAEDEGLWFFAQTGAEAYLQQELRHLHAAVENDTALDRLGSGEERPAPGGDSWPERQGATG